MDSEQINEKKREREATSAYGMGGGNGGEEKMKKKGEKLLCNQKRKCRGWVNINDR